MGFSDSPCCGVGVSFSPCCSAGDISVTDVQRGSPFCATVIDAYAAKGTPDVKLASELSAGLPTGFDSGARWCFWGFITTRGNQTCNRGRDVKQPNNGALDACTGVVHFWIYLSHDVSGSPCRATLTNVCGEKGTHLTDGFSGSACRATLTNAYGAICTHLTDGVSGSACRATITNAYGDGAKGYGDGAKGQFRSCAC